MKRHECDRCLRILIRAGAPLFLDGYRGGVHLCLDCAKDLALFFKNEEGVNPNQSSAPADGVGPSTGGY